MIGALKPYPAYKDSGLPWLGEIPPDWTIERTKTCFRLSIEKSGINHGRELLSVYTHIGVRPRKDLEERGNKATTTDHYWVVRHGDIIVNKLLAWMGAIGVSHYDGVTSPAYDILRPIEKVEPDYYHHLFRTGLYGQQFKIRSRGIMEMRLRLYFDQFGQIPIPIPPLEQQRLIVRFLDFADGRIGRYIRAKRRVIDLLNEEKLAIIRRAVTHGLDPNVRLRPSGVEWLGDVPGHWKLRKLKHLTRFLNGLPFKPGDWKDHGVPIIRIQNLNGSEEFNFTNRGDLPKELLIEPGDLVFSWSGNRGTSFGSFVWDRNFDGYLNQHIFKLVGYELHRHFFYYLLRAVTAHVEEQTHGIIGLVHITKPELGSIVVPVPDAHEQAAIAAQLDQTCYGSVSTSKKIGHEIEFIQEYRNRLFSDVLTGKLDVREFAKRLPDATESADNVETLADGDDFDVDATTEETNA